jgi:hypothetical protein
MSVAVFPGGHTFNGAGSQSFTVNPATPSSDDSLLSVELDMCSTQWTLSLPANDTLPTRICGLGSAMMAVPDGVNTCPHSFTFSVAYAASQPGTSVCDVLIRTEAYDGSLGSGSGSSYEEVRVTLYGEGGAGSGITVTPLTIDFKDVQIGTMSSPTSVVVKNNSNSMGTMVSMTLNGAGFTVMPNPPSVTLGPNGSASFAVRCEPTLEQAYNGTLTFSALSSPSLPHTVSLACQGIDSQIFVDPTQVNFGSTLVGRAPSSQTVRLTGNMSAEITSVTLDAMAIAKGVTIQPPNPVNMQIGTGKDIVLGWSAAAMHAAGPLGTLSITFDTEPQPRNVGILGEALLGGLGANPASVDFGAVCAGGSASKDIEVFADEAGDVVVMAPLVQPSQPFNATAMGGLPRTLEGNHAGMSLMLNASFAPTMPGDLRDAIALNSNIPNMGTTEIQLKGIGLAAGIAATPDVIHFGTAPTGSTTSIKEVQFTNCGTSDLMFNGAALTGETATEFTLIGANPPRVLEPTESEKFMIVMQPRSGGFKSSRLVINHDQGTTFVDLDGTGDGAGNNKERETYYACSTGGAAGLSPILIALLALRRRRR